MPKDLSVIFVAYPATQIRVARSEFTDEYDVHVVSFTLPVALQGDEFPVMQSRLPGSLAGLLSPRSQISGGSEYREPRPVARILVTSLAVSWLRPFPNEGPCGLFAGALLPCWFLPAVGHAVSHSFPRALACFWCERIVYRHGAILLIVRECSGFLPSAVTTLKMVCQAENK